jgi:hypothetical protein
MLCMRMVAMSMVKGGEQASARPGKGNGPSFPMIMSVGMVSMRMVTTVSSR